jgi:hypothetical protein
MTSSSRHKKRISVSVNSFRKLSREERVTFAVPVEAPIGITRLEIGSSYAGMDYKFDVGTTGTSGVNKFITKAGRRIATSPGQTETGQEPGDLSGSMVRKNL